MSGQDKDAFYQQLDQLDCINAELDKMIHIYKIKFFVQIYTPFF